MDENKVFSSAASFKKEWRAAVREIATKAKKDLAGKTCDLLLVFVSEMYDDFNPQAFAKLLSELLPCRTLIGCNSNGVISDAEEVEMQPAISILAMHLPHVRLYPFYLSGDDVDRLETGADLLAKFDLYPPDQPHFLCVGEPGSTDISKFLKIFNEAYKGLPVIGGMAAGRVAGKENWICINDAVYQEGVAGVAMAGNIHFEMIVSQGCRPIGKPYTITRADDGTLYELAGRPALQIVHELFQELSPRDRKLAQESLFAGLAMNEQQASFKRGDFLIRNLMGFDPDQGSLTIGAHLRVGQTLQFQVRDAKTSEEDLNELLEKMPKHQDAKARGAFLVSCCGRGQNLFGIPDHDAKTIQTHQGPLPMTGFFANGEIGPIQKKNYIHGFTSSLVIFY